MLLKCCLLPCIMPSVYDTAEYSAIRTFPVDSAISERFRRSGYMVWRGGRNGIYTSLRVLTALFCVAVHPPLQPTVLGWTHICTLAALCRANCDVNTAKLRLAETLWENEVLSLMMHSPSDNLKPSTLLQFNVPGLWSEVGIQVSWIVS